MDRLVTVSADSLAAVLDSLEHEYAKPELTEALRHLRAALDSPPPTRYSLGETGLGYGIVPRANGEYMRVDAVSKMSLPCRK